MHTNTQGHISATEFLIMYSILFLMHADVWNADARIPFLSSRSRRLFFHTNYKKQNNHSRSNQASFCNLEILYLLFLLMHALYLCASCAFPEISNSFGNVYEENVLSHSRAGLNSLESHECTNRPWPSTLSHQIS